MPRRRRLRRVVAPPGFKSFRPHGAPHFKNRKVELHYEEYEAIKLADYEFLNHLEASELMGVSRATFARIYETARRKIAKALVETREITTVFGNAILDDSWFECAKCHSRFTMPENVAQSKCPLCANEEIIQLQI